MDRCSTVAAQAASRARLFLSYFPRRESRPSTIRKCHGNLYIEFALLHKFNLVRQVDHMASEECTGTTADNVWIEAGVGYGLPVSGSYGEYFSWADNGFVVSGGSTYHEHDDTTHHPNSSTFYGVLISPTGLTAQSTSFDVTIGPLLGSSTSWPTGYIFRHLRTGAANPLELASSRKLSLYYGDPVTLRTGWWYGPSGHTHDNSTWGFTNEITPDHYYSYYTTTSC